jgi:hypothetical protein
MFYIVETKEQLEQLGKPEHDACFINIITTNDNRHPSLTKPCLVYYNDGEKGYILPIDHSEAFKLDWETVKQFLSNIDIVYVLDKKFHLYFLPGDNLQDFNFINYVDESQFDTKVHTDFNREKYYINELNTLIPIPKHYEKWENIYKYLVDKLFFSKWYVANEFLNTKYTEVFYQIEKNGIGIDPRKFNKHFETTWKDNSIYGNTVYTQYNLYNLTTRPSNAFNGVNFAALPKGIARESFEPNNYVFVEFDYSAYHPRIIAKMIDYTFEGEPYDEVPKEIMFQNIYGGIRDEYAWFPFFTKLSDWLDKKWKEFKSTQLNSLMLPTGEAIPQIKIENPTPNKILSYLIQSYETYYNTLTLERVLKLLKGKKTKIVLYTYDSILLDVAKEDIKTLLPKIKQELEADGFPTRMSVGENYGALIKK